MLKQALWSDNLTIPAGRFYSGRRDANPADIQAAPVFRSGLVYFSFAF